MIPQSAGLPVRTIELHRIFAGPVDLVFKIWTDPRLIAMWWGLENATNPTCELDVRPGGRWRIDMRTSSGKLYRNEGIYLEVLENKRLVFSDIPDPEIAEWEGEPPGPRIHTIVFEDLGERTHVSLEVLFSTPADRERLVAFGMPSGLQQGLDRLAALVEALAGGNSDVRPGTGI